MRVVYSPHYSIDFTFSIHCESNYPLRKVPGSRDVGLPDGVTDAEYLALLEAELDRIWSRFRPELVFYQAGVDPLAGDRLGRLALTRDGLRRRDAAVLHRCLASGTPVVTLVGGGYARDVAETVDAQGHRAAAPRRSPVVTLVGGGYARDIAETVDAHADTVRIGRAVMGSLNTEEHRSDRGDTDWNGTGRG